MESGQMVAVFGAYGHTGQFVVEQLRERGYTPLLAGRDASKLHAMALSRPGVDIRQATVDDPASLDRALSGAAAVINCAGPFAVTSSPVIEAALRAKVPYVDVAAEIEALIDVFDQFTDSARDTVVVPAMAFYGGLGDLLATVALGDWATADEAHIAYGLSSWHPTNGTRATVRTSQQRRAGKGARYRGGKLEYHSEPSTTQEWRFPNPIGTQTVINEFTMADVFTFSQHVAVPEVRTYMSAIAVDDLVAPDTPAPTATDERGRSSQVFLVDAIVRSGSQERRVVGHGQDIYAVTAPLAVEAVHRILTGHTKTAGLATAGEMFDAPDFLRSLSAHISVETIQK